ncbi:MAG: rod shape-determining protein MreC [Myxococcales bacterium]|nr:rod shape-determining protein MreC [Myxococcales bacterium]MCB9520106.1 rod shape-determining protein MreC [Myxococcales bacterium]MCB9531832.1 rod shape-determining protein MreC [Myxococcales bacterium]
MFDLLLRFRTTALLGVYLLAAAALVLSGRRGVGPEVGVVGAATFQAMTGTQAAAHAATASVAGAWDRYLDLVAVGDENRRLRAELDRLRDEHTRLLGVMQENARLRAMVGFGEAHPQLELLPARVVAKDVSPFFRVLSVRLLVRDPRVHPGLPVVASSGVVGHVSAVVGTSAEVTLAVDPRSSIDVVVQHNRARGVVQGLGHADDYRARIAYLLRREEVALGDVVVTSGMGGRFPPDLVVGRIAAIREASHGLFQEVQVEPSVDFARLEEVFVILDDGAP